MKLSIVLSFWNEMAVLPEYVRRTRAVLNQLLGQSLIDEYELIFVDDASTDGSTEYLEGEAKEGDVHVIVMSRNVGVAECVLAGLQMAEGDAVVIMDCDLQDPPEVIPDLLLAWGAGVNGIEVVHTKRVKRDGEGVVKRSITRLGYTFLSRFSTVPLAVETGDFKLLSRRAVRMILNRQEHMPFIRGLVAQTRLRDASVEYRRAERFDGRENTHFPVLAPRTVSGHLNRTLIAFSDFPLKALLYFGLIAGALSIAYLGVVGLQKWMGWYEPGWPALMAGIVFFGSLNLVAVGILGLYINVIFLEVKNRTLYTVDRVVSLRNGPLPDGIEWPDKT